MKGIIIASFGSIYKEAVETSIGTIESKVRSLYRDVEVRRVFLSDALVEKWNEKYIKPILFLSCSTRFALLLSIEISYQIQAIISIILEEIVY